MLREEDWNTPKAGGERPPTDGWTVKKEISVPMPGAPGDIVCLSLGRGRWPSSAQRELVLVWSGRGRTQHASYRKPGPSALGGRSCVPPERAVPCRAAEAFCLRDFIAELSACLSLACSGFS